LEHVSLLQLFFQISTDFEIFKRFQVKVGLANLCSYRLIATIFPNRPELHFGQEVLHGDLQSLHYDHKLILGCITLFGPLKQILSDLNIFL
jgi:hypothetical protein